MNRREALKNLGLATGFVVVTPSLISLLQSCNSAPEGWQPVFFNTDETTFVSSIVDIIIPKTEDLPSASELNVIEFIDKYVAEVLDEQEQKHMRETLAEILNNLKGGAENLDKKTSDDYKAILDKYMLVKGEIDEEREANPPKPWVDHTNVINGTKDYLKPTKNEVLNNLKWLTINAYRTNEQIGENVMPYDPIPAQYTCGDLQELTGGKAWSLS
ncbi:MAG: gluconate 2-dehydrogenase subunit 3 family protein [Winogradskyella sp.]|uniref:gluconate 2-dehydrogenase subunit 3 family protein n=1 Tax=Winogradskyella sp. TaxID=1883156 RepID=UPI0025CFE2EB|nr:gluconate 2-dehydrogenase subunit 3 family protein [Winogradskyella sp.]NRB82216.1 gluconate 2-dehydrogenase subunit 3 family protein [Winogradskyella sp.]